MTTEHTTISRRSFLHGGALAAGVVAAASLTGCQPEPKTMAETGSSEAPSEDWLGQAPNIDDAQITETLDADILIVGAGAAGMVAAATAADAGADFIICEKSSSMQVSRHFIGAVNTICAQAVNAPAVDKGKLLNEAARYASNKCNASVIKTWINESADMIAWLDPIMQAHGEVCVVNPELDEHTGGTAYYLPVLQHLYVDKESGALGNERNAILESFINEKGHDIFYGYELVELAKDESGRVTGGVFKTKDGYARINAVKGVLLATGGYSANTEMVKALAPVVEKCVTSASFSPNCDGSGIKAGIWAGAARDIEAAPMIFDRGTCTPTDVAGYTADGQFAQIAPDNLLNFLGSQPFMKVSKNGVRFANESTPYDFICFAATEQPGGVWAQIFDANVKEDIFRFATVGCSAIIQQMLAGDAEFEQVFAPFFEAGILFKADTIDELADKLCLEGEAKANFLAEVEKYNEFYDAGEDADFGKEAYRLSAIREAPFYGCWSGGALLTTLDGLKINKDMQVINEEKQVIEGLYAAGDCSGSFFSGNYPEYLIGIACGRSMTFGRHAINHMMGN